MEIRCHYGLLAQDCGLSREIKRLNPANIYLPPDAGQEYFPGEEVPAEEPPAEEPPAEAVVEDEVLPEPLEYS